MNCPPPNDQFSQSVSQRNITFCSLMVPRKYRSVESHVNELRAQGTGTKMTIGLRTRLLLPLGAFVLFLGTYAIAFGKTALLAPGWLLALLLLLLGAMATNVE